MTGVEITEYLVDMYTNTPVADMGQILTDVDMPEVAIGMCAIIETAASIIFDDETFQIFVDALLSSIEG
jgi:hypothetical protein